MPILPCSTDVPFTWHRLLLPTFAAIAFVASTLPAAPVAEVVSPDGAIRFAATIGEDGRLTYSITSGGRSAIEPSRLGMKLDGVNLGLGATADAIERYSRDERYPILGGHSEGVDRCNGTRIAFTHAASGTAFTLEVRVFNDGVGFRWIVPGAETKLRVPDAATEFTLPPFSVVWVHDLVPHYEGIFTKKALPGPRGRNAPPAPAELEGLANVRAGDWTVVPLVAKLPEGGGYAFISESALAGYAGMALQSNGGGTFRARLGHAHPPSYPYVLRYGLDEADRLAQPAAIAGTITTPWRVIVVAKDLNGLVNNDVITNLAPPPDPALFPQGTKTAWVRPGRALWKYLQPGDSTPEAMKEYARLAGQLGFEHNVLEGYWERWTMEQRREVVEFSRQHGVSIWFWKHSRELRTPEAREAFFSMLADLGVAGAKIDFFDHEAKETIDLYQILLREAANHHVLLDFHGANKPTGEIRTWPNELTREAIHGFENSRTNPWSPVTTTMPFTRYLAGPADFTPVMFNERRRETSWAHQIATACVFTSPVMIYGARPADILANPAADLIKKMPTVWDQTIVLPESAIGELAAFARRRGDDWYIGVLNGVGGERTMDVPLAFLSADRNYDMLAFHDVAADSGALEREERAALRGDTLHFSMRPSGGYVARLTPKR